MNEETVGCGDFGWGSGLLAGVGRGVGVLGRGGIGTEDGGGTVGDEDLAEAWLGEAACGGNNSVGWSSRGSGDAG